MGLLVGKPEGDSMIVMDTVPSSQIGTETFVDMDKTLEYMAQCSDSIEKKKGLSVSGDGIIVIHLMWKPTLIVIYHQRMSAHKRRGKIPYLCGTPLWWTRCVH